MLRPESDMRAAERYRLPTFLIVGAPRCGTTSLARYLGAHRDVFMAPTKEIHYFDAQPDKGLAWYAAHFDGVRDEAMIGEATPNYLSSAEAIERIDHALPDVRAIAILRNPVDRAYSAYQHGCSIGRETRSFCDALEDELHGRSVMDRQGRPLPPYILEGRYAAQLERFSTHVPRERIHVALFEDLQHEPGPTYREVCAFLSVASDPVPAIVGQVVNGHQGFRSLALRGFVKGLPDRRVGRFASRALGAMNRRAASYPPMMADDRAVLRDMYRADIDALEDWLGRDLSAWRE